MQDIKIYAFSDEASPNIDNQIQALLKNRLQGMEIRNVDGTNISDITKEKAKEVKSKLDASGLKVWSIGSPIGKIGITDSFKEHLEKFKHTLQIAEILNAKNLRMFSFFIPKDKSADLYTEKVFERIEKFAEIAKDYDVALCHENEKGIYGDNAERCLEIHKQFPTIKAVFDPANFVQCGVDTLKAWELLKNYVHYLHIKDALADGFVVPAGKGIGNVEKITKDFIARGGKNFTIEPHLTVFSGFEVLENGEELRTHYKFSSNDIAFDTACESFKTLL